MKEHNQKFKKMTQRIKQFLRDETCPTLQPLSTAEKQHIIDTVKADECATLPLCTHLGQECDNGHIEFKWKLIEPAPDRLQHLITQMLFRLGEGRGACVYQIGVEDSGHPKGLCDDELIASITTIFLMAKQLRATASLTAIRRGTDGKMATLSIRRVTHIETRIEEEQKHVLNGNDIRVCVAGNESVGKSTLIGVMTRGELDDGHGFARMNVFRHRHEIFDGRTSAIAHHILGFDDAGTITNYKAFHRSEWHEIVRSSTKLITFVDHPGHERYFKTSVFGLTSHKPHYVLFTVSLDEFDARRRATDPQQAMRRSPAANVAVDKEHEWSQMLSLNLDGLLGGDGTCSSSSSSDNEEEEEEDDGQSAVHVDDNRDMKLAAVDATTAQKSNDPSGDYHKYLAMCESMNVPLFIVITKSDIDGAFHYERLPKMLRKISTVIEEKSHGKLGIKLVETSSEASRAARALSSSVTPYVPIIVTSCVNGEGLEILKTFLFSLSSSSPSPSSSTTTTATAATEFGIDDIYHVQNVGIVASGIVRCGTIAVDDRLSLGPDKRGHYRTVTIASIQVRRRDCSYAFEGQMASLHLAEIASKRELRRGMVLVDAAKCATAAHTCFSFEAHIDVLHACSLQENSQPILHIENIRQSAHILHLHCADHILRHGQNGCGVFTFLHSPEFIRCGMKIIIRKSHGPIAIGRVTKLLDSAEKPLVQPLNSLQKPQRLRTCKHKAKMFKSYLAKWKLEHMHMKKVSDAAAAAADSVDSAVGAATSSSEEKSDEKETFSTTDDEDNDDGELTSRKNLSKATHVQTRKSKSKKWALVWRSGLGFENFYPSMY